MLSALTTPPQSGRGTGAGRFLHGLHVCSDDVILCAKPVAYGRGGEPSYIKHQNRRLPGMAVTFDLLL